MKDYRKDFKILQREICGRPLVYLDNAATTQKPDQVLAALANYYTEHCANVGRGSHTLAREATELYESARKNVASFIGAEAEEIVFTRNTTHAINLLANCLSEKFDGGSVIADSIADHNSCTLPWQNAAKKSNAEHKTIGLDDSFTIDLEELKSLSRLDMISTNHCSNVLGTTNPVREVAEIAHDKGALFVMDAAQSVPHMKIDVKEIACDFMAFSGHKMLGPTGVGVLYGRSELLEDMSPIEWGGGMVSGDLLDLKAVSPPNRFEAGTPDIAGAIGLSAAIDYLESIGMDKIERHEKKLSSAAVDGLGDIASILGPKENRGGIVSFNLENLSSHELSDILDQSGIAIRAGHHCAGRLMKRLGVSDSARASFYLYNTAEEVEYLIDVVKSASSL